MLNITNDMHQMKDYNQSTTLVSIDLSAAFDLVDHDILVNRLENYLGFTAIVLHWFRSFVCERSQCVLVGKIKSETFHAKQGVPQGSVLGARLYPIRSPTVRYL